MFARPTKLLAAVRGAPRPVTWLYAVGFVLGIAFLVNHAVGAPSWFITQLLDLDGEDSVSAWLSSTQLALAAAAFGTPAAIAHTLRRDERRLLWILAAVLLAMSVDEACHVHEWIGLQTDRLLPSGDRDSSPFPATGIWMFVIGVPFVVLFSALAAALRRTLQRAPTAFMLLVAGTAIFLAGALGVELLANLAMDRGRGIAPQIFVEETLEMAGVTTIVWSGFAFACATIAEPLRGYSTVTDFARLRG